MTPADPTALRRCVLAAVVLHDIDATPHRRGVSLRGRPAVQLTWAEVQTAIGPAEPESATAIHRLARWLQARRWVADRPLAELAERVRPLGLPVDHVLHPGADWARVRVLGDSLHLGPGFTGLDPDHPDAVLPIPDPLLTAARVPVDAWWTGCLVYLERMGATAAGRYHARPDVPLRPMGDCDVVTLLASRTLRSTLIAGSAGMRPAAVPMRTRGWLELARIDPAFVVTAARLTEPEQRGFTRPLLLTEEEVSMVRAGGQPAALVLKDPAPPTKLLRDVLYR